MGGHARLGPSNHRWPHCPGSVREELSYAREPSSEAAIDGTGSHLLLELCLLSESGIDSDALTWVSRTIGEDTEDKPYGWVVTIDRATRVNMALHYLRRRRDELAVQFPCSVFVVEAESKSDPGGAFGRDDWWGTCDVTIMVMTDTNTPLYYEVIDYKDGRGWVAEKNNSQLLAYLGGKLRNHIGSGSDKVRPFRTELIQSCRMTIVQPKTNPPIRCQDSNAHDVMKHVSDLAWAAQLTDDPNAPLIPDNKGGKGYCQWCAHKSNCIARQAQGAQGVALMSNVSTTGGSLLESLQAGQIDVTTMPADKLAEALDATASIRSLIDSIETEAQRRVTEDPDALPGYGMGAGRGSRVWADDPETVEKKLKGMRLKKDQIYPAKLASPAQIEKIDSLTDRQKKKLQEEMITVMAGKPKLVKVSTTNKVTASLFADVDAAEEPAPATEPTAVQIPSFL